MGSARKRAGDWRRGALVPIERLDVTISKGWVTVKGDVEWLFQKMDAERVVRRLAGVKGWAERAEAERAAWSAPGVTQVNNHITLEL